MMAEKGSRKEKNQNIQVFVRLRPLNQRERDIKSLGVIEVVNHKEVVVRVSQTSSHTKKFTFDRAFSPAAKQVEVYQDVVSPLIEEVLAGYNCTVFAYGQTGTGKTHTMVGESASGEISWQNDPLAGIVPRALSQLFDELRLSNTEYTVRVSYLELYNEELFDLLASSEDNSKLRIYEDVTRKGSNIVNGLEEITVSNKNEVYKIMAQGQERKRVASTLMNAQSSRSHTVFTIVVHMRENSPEGEELVKIGKLNLVDLAGSENISKAGSDNPAKRERARECVNINQSLLTLGRVITALVERHPHIPYRESKLTRILQESLGGRTKTSIIATISPGHKDLEETMSTLEYANRAKNIQNKPEVNQKMTKKAILKEYADEIDRLKRDLQASRDKNGVYLATDTYTELTLKQEEQRKEIQELLLQKRAIEEQKDKVETLFSDLNSTLEKRESELIQTRSILTTTETQLLNTANKLKSTTNECEEQRYLVAAVSQTEQQLSAQARDILHAADDAAEHARCLHDVVDKRRNVESKNLQVTSSFRSQAAQHRANIAANSSHCALLLAEGLAELHTALDAFSTNSATTLQDNKVKLEDILQQLQDTMNEIRNLTDESHNKLVSAADVQRAGIRSSAASSLAAMQGAVRALSTGARALLDAAKDKDVTGHVATIVQLWYKGAAARVAALCETQRGFVGRAERAALAQADIAATQRDDLATRKAQRDGLIHNLNQKVEKDNMELEKRLSEQMEEIEEERRDSQRRLDVWMQTERRLLEQRLMEHAHSETTALEERLSKKIEAINQERVNLQARMSSHMELQQRLLEANATEMQLLLEEAQGRETSAGEGQSCLTSYHKEFDEGAYAISTDMEVFSGNVVEVVEHVYRELLQAMHQANEHTEEVAQSVVREVEVAGAQFVAETDAALTDLVTTNRGVVQDMLHSMQEKNSTTSDTLTSVAESLSSLACKCDDQRGQHGQQLQQLSGQLALFSDTVSHAVRDLEQAESQCLDHEYKVYSPTGKTPSRAEYRYPRALAATSPHDRIIARFRAMRAESRNNDCVVVESEDSLAASDCESSASEDSAVFAVPSPLVPTPRNHTQPNMQVRRQPPIVKCTSETDIYDIKREEDQGKENANRSASGKKPSKLPALASLKKPFLERNGTDH